MPCLSFSPSQSTFLLRRRQGAGATETLHLPAEETGAPDLTREWVAVGADTDANLPALLSRVRCPFHSRRRGLNTESDPMGAAKPLVSVASQLLSKQFTEIPQGARRCSEGCPERDRAEREKAQSGSREKSHCSAPPPQQGPARPKPLPVPTLL